MLKIVTSKKLNANIIFCETKLTLQLVRCSTVYKTRNSVVLCKRNGNFKLEVTSATFTCQRSHKVKYVTKRILFCSLGGFSWMKFRNSIHGESSLTTHFFRFSILLTSRRIIYLCRNDENTYDIVYSSLRKAAVERGCVRIWKKCSRHFQLAGGNCKKIVHVLFCRNNNGELFILTCSAFLSVIFIHNCCI